MTPDIEMLRTVNTQLQQLYDQTEQERQRLLKALKKTIKQNKRMNRQLAELRGKHADNG